MAIATSNRTALRWVEETVFGTTPSSPALNDLRYTGESLNYNIANIVSNEIRSDRMTSDLIQTQADASGGVDAELSYGTFDTWFVHAFHDTAWSTPVAISATDIAATGSNTFTSGATDFTAQNIEVGQWLRVGGFTDPANNGYFRVTAIAAGVLTVEGGTTVIEGAGATITMDGEHLSNGVTEKSMTIQKHFQDATADEFINFTGVKNNGFTLNLATGEIVTINWDLIGLSAAGASAQLAGATTVPANGNDVMNAVGNVQGVWIDGAVSTACFGAMTLTLNNNQRGIECIGTLGYTDVVPGRLEVTGTVEIFFEDRTEWDKFVAATSFSFAIGIEDAAGNAYILTIPNAKYETGTLVSSGLDTDIVFSADFRGILDTATSAMITLDRIAA